MFSNFQPKDGGSNRKISRHSLHPDDDTEIIEVLPKPHPMIVRPSKQNVPPPDATSDADIESLADIPVLEDGMRSGLSTSNGDRPSPKIDPQGRSTKL